MSSKIYQRILMAEALSFEQKVQGLIDYYHALGKLDPLNEDHAEVANPEVLYSGSGSIQSRGMREIQQGLLGDLSNHGRREYGNRGLAALDLREDTDELRAERADVLAVMTAPLTPEVREVRKERIAEVLSCGVSGEPLVVAKFDRSQGRYNQWTEVTVDVSRALFGVFRNGHISDRTLTVQYDKPDTYLASDYGEKVLDIDIPQLFQSNHLVVEPAAA
jgi:hypothetical protein